MLELHSGENAAALRPSYRPLPDARFTPLSAKSFVERSSLLSFPSEKTLPGPRDFGLSQLTRNGWASRGVDGFANELCSEGEGLVGLDEDGLNMVRRGGTCGTCLVGDGRTVPCRGLNLCQLNWIIIVDLGEHIQNHSFRTPGTRIHIQVCERT